MALPNIILLLMDSAAAKRCSVYGHRRPTTPGLARIAEEGVLYKYCFSPGAWTLPTHASLFSGLYPREHGCNTPDFTFPGNYYTLAEILRELGYRTIGISSNSVVSRLCNFNWGFDEFYEMHTLFNSERYTNLWTSIRAARGSLKGDLDEVRLIFKTAFEKKYYSYPLKHMIDRVWRKFRGNITYQSSHATERSVRLAKRAIARSRRPFFLFINFMEVHSVYNPPRRFRQALSDGDAAYDREQLLYEQELAYLDDRLFNLYNFLDRAGLKDDTMFIVTADHGEGFGEHGVFHHVLSVYNELTHIPLIIKYPAAVGARGPSPQLAQLNDLFATVLEVAGAPLPAPESSRSLLGPAREYALSENLETAFIMRKRFRKGKPPDVAQPCLSLVTPGLHKLIHWADGRQELYDLEKDYGETVNLVDDPAYREQAAGLQEKLGQVTRKEALGKWGTAALEPPEAEGQA